MITAACKIELEKTNVQWRAVGSAGNESVVAEADVRPDFNRSSGGAPIHSTATVQ